MISKKNENRIYEAKIREIKRVFNYSKILQKYFISQLEKPSKKNKYKNKIDYIIEDIKKTFIS